MLHFFFSIIYLYFKSKKISLNIPGTNPSSVEKSLSLHVLFGPFAQTMPAWYMLNCQSELVP